MAWSKNPNDPLYRYLEPEWADSLCSNGNIRINSLAYFRDMEGPQRDPLDGSSSWLSGDFRLSNSSDNPLATAVLKSARIGVTDCSDMSFSGLRVIQHVPGAALCLSYLSSTLHFLSGAKTAVVEIPSPPRFAAAITVAAAGRLGQHFIIGEVEYANDRSTGGLSFAATPDAFKKEHRFRHEHEVRMLWPDSDGSNVIITDPAIAKLVKRIA